MTDNSDWVTAQIMAVGGAAARKLQRLRDAADHSMLYSSAHLAYANFHTLCRDDLAAAIEQAQAEENKAVDRALAEANIARAVLADPDRRPERNGDGNVCRIHLYDCGGEGRGRPPDG